MPDADAKTRDEVVNKFTTHFHEVFEQIDRSVKELFDEAVADGEDVEKFVYAKLKLRSYEIFQSFDRDNQQELLVDDRRADLRRRQRRIPRRRSSATSSRRCSTEPTLSTRGHRDRRDARTSRSTEPLGAAAPTRSTITRSSQPLRASLLGGSRSHQAAGRRRPRAACIASASSSTRSARTGTGKLAGKQSIAEFAGQQPFLDGHVYVHPTKPDRVYELTVLGDLHGCYSCLKGALLQADFFAKLEAWKLDTTQARAEARPPRRLHRSRPVQLQRRAARGDAAVPRGARSRVPAARQPRVLHRVSAAASTAA